VTAQESAAAATEESAIDNELEDLNEADQLAVASSPQEQLVELPGVGGAGSPLAFLIATAAGASSAAGPILPLAPQHFRYVYCVTRVFIKQIFRTVELAPPFPLPLTRLCRGWGSGSFQPQVLALVMPMKK
jgi:hypothetical protein